MPKAAPLNEARILIVDDRESDVRLLERILGRGGYTNITGMSDPRKFSAVFQETDPDIILLDLNMPHLDGFAVLNLLQGQIEEDAYLPVLILTSDDTIEAMWRTFSLGAKDFVAKPFNAQEVLLRVKNLLETRQLYLQLQGQNSG
jgi:putative two-component system response regulator